MNDIGSPALKERSLLTIEKVMERTGMARSTVYAAVSDNRFPKPIHTGPNSSRWLSTEIEDWIDKLAAAPRVLGKGVRRASPKRETTKPRAATRKGARRGR